MNTLEIVLLSLLAGLAVALLIAAAVYLAWMLHTAKHELLVMQKATAAASADISLLRTQIDAILNVHRQEMSAMIARINGDKLVEASHVIVRSAQRIETACVAFGQLAASMLANEGTDIGGGLGEGLSDPDAISSLQRVRNSRSGLGPESYAPNPTGEKWVSQSRTAAQDSGELLGESGEDIEGQ